MAERRMFAKTIIDSDAFLDMPMSARLLYYDLGMRADDDGFVNSPKKIMKMVGASTDDMNVLILRKFILPFETGVVVIKHWKIHNYIQNDRYRETNYKNEKSQLALDENKAYKVVDTECIQSGYIMDTQDRLGKDRLELGKERLEIEKSKGNIEIITPDEQEDISYKEIVDYLNQRIGSNYKPNASKTKTSIHARVQEGYTLEDFKIVIDKKVNEWYGTDMAKYLRPETLFGTKFEGYLNQPETQRVITTKDIENRIDWSDMIYD